MIVRPLSALTLVIAVVLPALADESERFDCHAAVEGLTFDLTPLNREHVVNRTRDLPPTKQTDSLRFNLCNQLSKIEFLKERDQCDSGTRACLTQVNEKEGEPDRVVSVIPLMSAEKSKLSFQAEIASTKSLTIISEGATYPHPIHAGPTKQTLRITLLCTSGEDSDPKFEAYDGAESKVEWKTSAACPLRAGDGDSDNKDDTNPPPPEGGAKRSSSGVGWFFLMLFLAFVAYFCIGAYYNYSTYGARGLDLVPHRDFWQEVPYMLRDVVSHLCSSSRPRRASDRGYIAV